MISFRNVAVTAALLTALIAPASGAQLAVTPTGGRTFAGDGPWTLGFSFDVLNPFTVRSLGVYDSGLNGLGQSHAVGIWDGGGNLLISGTVGSGVSGSLLGDFRMVNVSPFVLAVGTGYRVGAAWGNVDAYLLDAAISSDPSIRYVSSGFNYGGGLVNPTADGTYGGYFGGNFAGDAVVATPEPASLVLVASGLIGIFAIRRRR
jgi:hypothetical protein